MPTTTETPEQIEKQLKHAFAQFDTDGDGKITKSELVGILTKPLPNRTPFTGRSVFDLSVSTRPGASEVVGRREKQKTKNTGGPGARHEKKTQSYP